MVLWIARQAEQAFTDGLKQCYIVNGEKTYRKFTCKLRLIFINELHKYLCAANFVFTAIWNLIRPVLGRAVYKVDVFGTNRDQWTPRILKIFPKDQLPAWYGGVSDHKPVQVYG